MTNTCTSQDGQDRASRFRRARRRSPRKERITMNTTWGTTLVAGTLALWASSAAAQAPSERPSDKAVKALIQQVDEGRDKFEGNLDGRFKGSIVKGPRGEVKVAGALQDYQDSTQKLMNRFTPEYSANPEVATVLTQSMAIDQFMQAQPSSMKGYPEWGRQLVFVKRLAEAYSTTYPLPEGATPRRLNDKEVVAAAGGIAKSADHLKDSIDDDKAIGKPEKDAAKKDLDVLINQAQTVKSRINDSKPASVEVRQLAAQAAKVEAFLETRFLATTPDWQTVKTSIATLRQAFGVMS
jgi:hypothetical protein